MLVDLCASVVNALMSYFYYFMYPERDGTTKEWKSDQINIFS